MNTLIESQEIELNCLMSKAQGRLQVIAMEPIHMSFKIRALDLG